MSQHYSNPNRERDPRALPDIEVFYQDKPCTDDGQELEPGFYYWFCFPGCLPLSEPVGPFQTRDLALLDAQSHND